jgi:hypothetical protein
MYIDFDEYIVPCIHYYSDIKKSDTDLKHDLGFMHSTLLFSLQTSGNNLVVAISLVSLFPK